jgi:hypothetical protein
MTDRITQLSGTIADGRGQPVPGSNIVVFSTDRDRWYPASRYLRQSVSRPDGSFIVAGLPAGIYLACAVARIPGDGEDAWQDPQFLESIAARASTVTLVEGQRTELALRLSAP